MSLQDSTLNTAHILDNEIVKANDFEFAFAKIAENVSRATQMILESNQDFVINGKVLPYQGMNVQISPIYGVCKSTGVPFGRTETAIMEYGFEGSTSGRVDIIEVHGEWETYDNQQRAFNDPDTNVQTYQYVDTKKLLRPAYKIKKGVEGSSVAPEVDEGYVKLAEVVIRANASSILAADIKNITADIAGLDNEDWTTEPDITYNIGYISDVNARFRVAHNEDGTHQDDCIDSDMLDIGTGAKQVNGSILPIGSAITIPEQTTASTDSIVSTITKVVTVVTSLFNNYLKYGAYGFKGPLNISSLADESNNLTKPITITANGDGTATIQVNGTTVLSIDASGKLSTSGYTASSNNNIVTKAVTDAISTALTNLTTRVTTAEGNINGLYPYANKVLSTDRFVVDTGISIVVATTANITLSGTQTIDGKALTAGQKVLVKNQNEPKNNGLYQVETSSWTRASGYTTPANLKGKIFIVNEGTANSGKMYYIPNETFTNSAQFGSDAINFVEFIGSVKNLASKVVVRDSSGRVKTSSPSASEDAVNKGFLTIDNLGIPTGLVAATCSTAAATAAKTVTLTGFSLKKGAKLMLTISTTNTAASATLNVNSTGAKPIYVNGAVVPATGTISTPAAGTYIAEYDGTNWCLDSSYMTKNARSSGSCSGNAETATKLQTARKTYVALGTASTTTTRDWSGDTTIPVDGTLAIGNGGTGKTTILDVQSDFGIAGYCSTEAATAAKTATINGYKLIVGQVFRIYIKTTNTAASATLNISDGSSNTGAKPIYVNGTVVPASGTISTPAAGWYVGIYDGANYQLLSTNTNVLPSVGCAVCFTAGSTAAKKAIMPGFTLTSGSTFLLYMQNSNTVASPTLSINGLTAKSVYINNAAATASNFVAGIYLCRYNGTNFYIDTGYFVTNARTANSATSATSAGSCTGNAATATNLAAKKTINGVKFDGSANINNYAECSTAAGTAAKVVTCTGFVLATGAEITVKFTVTNTADNPTLNVSDGTNYTGAKAIYYRGAAISKGYLAANRTYTFRYNGTQYELVGDIDTNTTYLNFKASGTGAAAGLVPSPGATAGSTKFLCEDATWKTPPYPIDFVKSGTGAAAGLVPSPGATAGSTKFLCENATWKTPPVTGVKGNSESSYRTGNVNITAPNIGLGNVNNTADAAKTVLKAAGLSVLSCSTASGTAAKTVTLANFALYTGARLYILFSNANTAATPTLNVNSTGAIAIKVGSGATSTDPANPSTTSGAWNGIQANVIYEAYYDGTYWRLSRANGNMLGVKAYYFSADSGYIVFTNGLIEQWGISNISTTQNKTSVTFPIPYTNQPPVVITDIYYSGLGTWDYPIFTTDITKTTFTYYHYSTSANGKVYWKAIGY